MIDIAAGATEFDGITVFPDDEDTRRWYFVSARPRITTNADGKAAFQLMKYRRVPASGDAGGGGLLDLGVDLGVTPESIERATAGLRASHPGVDVTLVPVPADRITCEIRLDL